MRLGTPTATTSITTAAAISRIRAPAFLGAVRRAKGAAAPIANKAAAGAARRGRSPAIRGRRRLRAANATTAKNVNANTGRVRSHRSNSRSMHATAASPPRTTKTTLGESTTVEVA